MKALTPTKYLPQVFVFGLLVCPYLIILGHMQFNESWPWEELGWALRNSLVQSFFSAALASILSVVLASGLLALPEGWLRSGVERLLPLPAFLPTLVVVVLLLSWLEPFPIGTVGVVLAHGVLCCGLLAVDLFQSLRRQCTSMAETALIFGAGPWKIWRLVIRSQFPLLKKHFFLIFTIAFTSFSIPLILGGGKGTSIEILIYEKIKISGDWSQATFLSIFQLGALAFLSFFVWRGGSGVEVRSQPAMRPSFSTPKFFAVFPCLYVAFFIGGFIYDAFTGWSQLSQLPFWQEEIVSRIAPSFFTSVLGGFFILLILSLSLWAWPVSWFRYFLLSYVAPSTALLGFGLLFFSSLPAQYEFVIYSFGFAILVAPGLYRLALDARMSELERQIQVAEVLGAGPSQVWSQIVLPQTTSTLFRLSGLGGLWLMGDFALSKILFSTDRTLSLLVEGMMSSYRVEAATALTGLLVALGLVVFLFFEVAGYVYSRKFN